MPAPMTILLDENIPHFLKRLLSEFEVVSVQELGLSGTKNGALLALIDGTYDAFITADKNLKYQQNLATRKIAIIELYSNRLPEIKRMGGRVRTVLTTLNEGEFVVIAPPEAKE